MWRHPALRPLSREHFAALMIVRDVRWAVLAGEPAIVARANLELTRAWRGGLTAHFDREDRCLRPLLTPDERAELDRQHAALRAAFARLVAADVPDPDLALQCADALHDHARWEEAVLFTALQARVDDAQLSRALAEHIADPG